MSTLRPIGAPTASVAVKAELHQVRPGCIFPCWEICGSFRIGGRWMTAAGSPTDSERPTESQRPSCAAGAGRDNVLTQAGFIPQDRPGGRGYPRLHRCLFVLRTEAIQARGEIGWAWCTGVGK